MPLFIIVQGTFVPPLCPAFTVGDVTNMYVGDAVINTAADISALAGYDGISGNVTAYGGSVTITNFSGLEGLRYIGGNLTIGNNSTITSLQGLENLTTVNGYFDLGTNSVLTSVVPYLDSLRVANGGLFIYNNNSLTNLDDLCPCLTDVNGGIQVDNFTAADVLVSVQNAFPNVTTITGELDIDIDSVCNLTGSFANLTTAANVAVFRLKTGSTLSFASLATITNGGLLLQNLNGFCPSFPALTSVTHTSGNGIYIRNNTGSFVINSSTFPLLSTLSATNSSIWIRNNTGLTSIAGAFQSLTTANAGIDIDGNTVLTSMTGAFSSINNLPWFSANTNASLLNIDAFASWTNGSPGGTTTTYVTVQILENDALLSIDLNLVSSHKIIIGNNDVLNDISSLLSLDGSQVTTLTPPGAAGLDVYNNPLLSSSSQIQPFFNNLIGEGFTGTTNDSGNGA